VAGIHASLLPKYRGGAPLVWAIINGEKTTGVSLFYFDQGVDTGDVIAQKKIEISDTDDIRTVYEKATLAAVDVLRESLPLIREGQAPRIPQDHANATIFPQRKPEDGLIDWTRTPDEIRNFIRAQTRPYPGAFTVLEGKKVTIWDADIVDLNSENNQD
jgi:methionyl-tRNA formyltransferase